MPGYAGRSYHGDDGNVWNLTKARYDATFSAGKLLHG